MPNEISTNQSIFPTMEDVMQLARAMVNDLFPGVAGQVGRILSDSSPFTIIYLNSAFRTIQRKLRNEGCTFPIVDGYIITGLPPVVNPDPGIFCQISQLGYNNGTQVFAALKLPSDCFNVQRCRQRQTNTNLQFTTMIPANGGLSSQYQNNWLGMWEWRGYSIFFNGSTQQQDMMIRYTQGQPPLAAPPADFSTTQIAIQDSQEALAAHVAWMYGSTRGGNAAGVASAKATRDEAIDDMALEQIRAKQVETARRASYQGGGSDNTGNTSLGSTGVVS